MEARKKSGIDDFVLIDGNMFLLGFLFLFYYFKIKKNFNYFSKLEMVSIGLRALGPIPHEIILKK